MNIKMITEFIFLSIFILTKFTISMETVVPLLNEKVTNDKVSWSLSCEAKNNFSLFQHKTFHVFAIGGPTRSGKSFIIGHILKQLKDLGGQTHFGEFVHRSTTESVTKGMDIALVEYKGKFILLIDCEGLKSASKPMDPKLMLIMSMISQKMIYLTKNVDQYMIDDISSMIANLKQIDLGEGSKKMNLPLNSLYVVLNQTEFEGDARNEKFLENNLTEENQNLFNSVFPKRKLIFITEEPKSVEECSDEEEFLELKALFNSDISNLFDEMINDLPSFTFGDKEITIGEFMSYLNYNVLNPINNNEKICFPDIVGEVFNTYAEQVINEMHFVNRLPFNFWVKQWSLDFRVQEIRNLKDIFDQKTLAYREHVKDIRNKYFQELEEDIQKICRTNDINGQKIIKSEPERWANGKKKYLGTKDNGGWFPWTTTKWNKYAKYYDNRTKYTHRNGTISYSIITESYDTYYV